MSFQSTRPRGARLFLPPEEQQRPAVSIHAPARGATLTVNGAGVRIAVSIHAPARGATRAWRRSGRYSAGFNPRAREGRDIRCCDVVLIQNCFNPRAREGRDRSCCKSPLCRVGFNPRAREGRDPFTTCSTLSVVMFQSTRPRGARPARVWQPLISIGVSIHAPARGATRQKLLDKGREASFNPRAREGRDVVRWSDRSASARFNPRAREGRDRWKRYHLCGLWCFNPRAREGRDNPARSRVSSMYSFQSTRPRGARPAPTNN